MTDKKVYTLYTILKGIRNYLEVRIKGKEFWLKVELANINFHSSGHCYLELAETENGRSIAQCKGAIWKSTLTNIRNSLGGDFNNIIKKGNEVLFLVEIQFTEQYGLNIIVKDVDINFSLGALEKKKQETIDRLKKEELLNKNKEIKVPIVIQKIAIIGSPETAGITDLKKQLENNSYGYHFDYQIYPCLVQGEKAEFEIVDQLKQLTTSSFQIIALIRGGGSKLDLDVFNSYSICREIALHPIPVFTGIGHETDISVADLVANVHHKTPSALGSYIVEKAHNYEVKVISAYSYIIEYKNKILEEKKSHLKLNIQTLTSKSISITQIRRGDLHSNMNRIISEARQKLNAEQNIIRVGEEVLKSNPSAYIITLNKKLNHTLELIQINSEGKIKNALSEFNQIMELIVSYSLKKIEEKLKYTSHVNDIIGVYHPDNILLKGYAIPKIDGKLLKTQELDKNTELEIELFKRIIIVSYLKDKPKWKTSIMNKLLKN
ncbi:exodeoxyribonuclease VII large subunit [Maribellus sp. CM-23]|uniref:exodeoxyribonuclease VII large subunit n=1 Tax=Maribellus sp. CM-23 TaxID=2781026 RepID=UPI001F231FCE|nr:exodeoxyribonuclease VII large subunit [Maribellus sp. CM-23]MCE4566028.1 exodeoxyribonuclease VII large subunit [Maribellus sp. CM-23]